MYKFLVKLILNGIVIVTLLMWFTEASFGSSLITSIVLSVIAFFIGDQLILRMSNNTVATIADAVMAFVFLWIVAASLDWALSMPELFGIVIALAIVEAIYHRMLGHDDRAQNKS